VLACRTFGVSETCYRSSPRLSDENERIGDLLVGLPMSIRPGSLAFASLRTRPSSNAC